MRTTASRNGFTLIELLVVIAIIATLVAILLPAVQQAREAARRSTCKNNLKQIALAIHNYHDTHGVFPAGLYGQINSSESGRRYEGDAPGWFQMILPMVEQGAIYDQMAPNMSQNMGACLFSGRFSVVPTFTCPSDPNSPKVARITSNWWGEHGFCGNYLACAGSKVLTPNADVAEDTSTRELEADVQDDFGTRRDGVFYGRSKHTFGDVIDGVSNTIFLGETLLMPDVSLTATGQDLRGAYYFARRGGGLFSTLQPPNSLIGDRSTSCIDTLQTPCNGVGTDNMVYLSRSYHRGGAQFAFGDGAVRFLSENVDRPTFQLLGARNDGRVAGEF